VIILSITDISGLNIQFQSIKKLLHEIFEKKGEKNFRMYDYRSMIDNAFFSYNNAVKDLESLKDSINYSISIYKINEYETKNFSAYELNGFIPLIIIECEKVIGILKNKLSVPLTESQKNRLSSISHQIKKLDLDYYYEKNLNLAVDHFEKGNFLACSLISSRIIVYCMDQIPQANIDNQNKKLMKSKDEKRIDYLIEKNIMSKKERDQKTRIFKYVTNARNFLVHDIKVFPDASDSMSLLGDCIDILKILTKIEEI